jgi:hypothetical protein
MSDSEFIASHEISPQHPITEGFYSNVRKIVKLEGYIFETLWENAIPAAERINQLETAAGYAPAGPNYALKEQKKKVIDRFYVCEQCRSTFIYADDAQEHQTATGHGRAKEFPFFS